MFRTALPKAIGLLAFTFQVVAAAERTCPIPTCDARLIGRRELRAGVAKTPPAIDGRLNEVAWADAPTATGFVQGRPVPGAASRLRTMARVLVDDRALYVGVRLDDPHAAGILAPFLRRDDEGLSDWVFVEIDSRHDRRSAFSFGVNPRGVQVDGAFADDVNFDSAWNATWEGSARLDDEGWTAEFRIPLSQLSFKDAGGQVVWGFNVYRYSPQYGESSNWSPRFGGLPGVVSQFNDLQLTLSGAPRRLEVAPFVAPRLEREGARVESRLQAGADLSVGLGSNFGLNATLFPDFGQVEADPSQMNLTTFELYQTERRPFFVEDAGAFRFDASLDFATRDASFAEESPFYSRRVGQGLTPLADTGEADRPEGAAVLAAAKLSGRTSNGWTLGLFGALTGRDGAVLGGSGRDSIEPTVLTAVGRASRSLRGGESGIGFLAGVVARSGLGAPLADRVSRRAWVAGIDGRHRFGDQRYEARGWFLGSGLDGTPAAIAAIARDPRHGFGRPDASGRDARGGGLNGLAAQARFGRVSGAWRWSAAVETVSRGFEMNDLGFQRNADWTIVKADWQHEIVTADRPVRQWTIGSSGLGLAWTTAGESRARVADVFLKADFRNHWDATVDWVHDFPALSPEWLRGGPTLLLPARDTLRLVVDTDQRRPSWTASLDARLAREAANGSWLVSLAPLVNLRANAHVAGSLGAGYTDETVGWQYLAGGGGTWLVSRLRQQTLSITGRFDVGFDVHTQLQVYLQPFLSVGRSDRYQRLTSPRAEAPADRFAGVTPDRLGDGRLAVVRSDGSLFAFAAPDGVRQAFNATAVFRWEYRPGSFLSVVWNRRRDTVRSARTSLGEALERFGGPAADVFLVKLSLRLGR